MSDITEYFQFSVGKIIKKMSGAVGKGQKESLLIFTVKQLSLEKINMLASVLLSLKNEAQKASRSSRLQYTF